MHSKKLLGIGTILYLAAAPLAARAHSIDYLAPTNASGSNVTLTKSGQHISVTSTVAGGSTIWMDLTVGLVPHGPTASFPRPVTFATQVTNKPAGASDPGVVLDPNNHEFTASSQSFVSRVTVSVPSTPGPYQVKIYAASGTGGSVGIVGDNLVHINFTVAAPAADPVCEPAPTTVNVAGGCILLHQPSTTLAATLTSGSVPLVGRTLTFKVGSAVVGTATTDANGTASLAYNTSALTIGDHTVTVEFAGEGCSYQPSSGSGTLGVSYLFHGYQQPINADGSSRFSGKVIPVKVKISDANGASVSNASAHVFFALGTSAVVGTEAEPLASTSPDGGNTMRYDANADQYIFNWDIGSRPNGTYTIRTSLGEGACGTPRTVIVSVQRRSR